VVVVVVMIISFFTSSFTAMNQFNPSSFNKFLLSFPYVGIRKVEEVHSRKPAILVV
jgi:hypothetical protein